MSVTYLGGAGPADVAMPGGKLVIAIRDTRGFLSAGWAARVKSFVENVPGASAVAFVLPPEVSDDSRRVAAFYMRLMGSLPPGTTLSQVVRQIEPAFTGGEVYRLRVVPRDAHVTSAMLNAEISAAATEDQKRDEEQKRSAWYTRLVETIKKLFKTLGVFVLVVLVLLIVLAFVRRRTPKPAESSV